MRTKTGRVVETRPNKDGYLTVRCGGKLLYLHRVKFFLLRGHLPKRVDHRDEDRSNNLGDNLRPATQAQNMRNIKRRRGRGIRQCGGKFQAAAHHPNGKVHFGMFDTFEEAELVVEAYLQTLHGEFYQPPDGAFTPWNP